MKKFLLSLCVLAIASVCVFMTSCKDSDEQTPLKTNAKEVIAAAEDPGYTYTYVLNGQTYDNLDALNAAISTLPAGSTNTVYVVATPDNGGAPKQGQTTTFQAPNPGQSVSVPVVVPGNTNKPVNVVITNGDSRHSGGSAR